MKHNLPTFYPGKILTLLFVYFLATGYTFSGKSGILKAEAAKPALKPLRLFIIGNSFSQNAATYLPQLAKEKGKELVIGRAELGGCSLERHWKLAAAAEASPNDSAGKVYRGKSLRMLLSEGVWDVVTLQQYSMLSSDAATYRPYAKKLYDYIKSIQPHAKIVLHQTWAYRADDTSYGKIEGEIRAKNAAEMYASSRKAYHTIADELDVPVIPVGDAFWKVSTHPKWAFKGDKNFKKEEAVYPALPNEKNSLHVGYRWNKGHTLEYDTHHAGAAGCYLGSLVWFRFLFGTPAQQIRFKPADVSDEFAVALKKAAASVAMPVLQKAALP